MPVGKGFSQRKERDTHMSQSCLPAMLTHTDFQIQTNGEKDLFSEYLCYFKQRAQNAFLKGHLLYI